jgi:hypothetical protein
MTKNALAKNVAPSAVAIVRTVQKSTELIAAESELRTLQERQRTIQADVQNKSDKLNFPSSIRRPLVAREEDDIRREIKAGEDELKIIDGAVRATRRIIEQHRPAYTQAVCVELWLRFAAPMLSGSLTPSLNSSWPRRGWRKPLRRSRKLVPARGACQSRFT